jgi:hypothetical protein
MKLKNIEKSASSLGQRYYTLSVAINVFKQTYGRNIAQLGSEPRDSAHSNFDLFDFYAELALNCKKVTYSIFHDSELIKEQNRERILNSKIYRQYSKVSDRIKVKNIKDHNTFEINNNIDLLILNDIHFPIEELTARVCPSSDYLSGRNILNSMEEREILDGHGDLINPSKERALFEYKLLRSKLSKSSVVILEGNDYPGGSQTSLVKKQLGSDGFICLLDLQQSVWIRR